MAKISKIKIRPSNDVATKQLASLDLVWGQHMEERNKLIGKQVRLSDNENLYMRVEDVLYHSLLSLTCAGAILLLALIGDTSGFRAIFGMVWALFLIAIDIAIIVCQKKESRIRADLAVVNQALQECRQKIDWTSQEIEKWKRQAGIDI